MEDLVNMFDMGCMSDKEYLHENQEQIDQEIEKAIHNEPDPSIELVDDDLIEIQLAKESTEEWTKHLILD